MKRLLVVNFTLLLAVLVVGCAAADETNGRPQAVNPPAVTPVPTVTPTPLPDDALIRRNPSGWGFPDQPGTGSALSFVPGELLVTFKPGTEQSQIDSLNKQQGAAVLSVIPPMNVYHLKVSEADVERVLEGYRSSLLVEAAQRNFISYP